MLSWEENEKKFITSGLEQHEDVQWKKSNPLRWTGGIKCLAQWYHKVAYVRLEPDIFGPEFEHFNRTTNVCIQRLQ